MAKLYFRHGTVGSAKTLNLLAVAHNYERQGKTVRVVKPSFDTRFGSDKVVSRAGLQRPAHVILDDEGSLDVKVYEGCQCVLVDEAQFLSAAQVDQLRDLTRTLDVPVICYGLRTDFRSRLFEGSRRLFELADSIEELKTTCAYCNRKAIFNLKAVNGEATLSGPSKQLGAEETYQPVCSSHYSTRLAMDSFSEIESRSEEEIPG